MSVMLGARWDEPAQNDRFAEAKRRGLIDYAEVNFPIPYEADPALLFDDGVDTKYQRALGKIGIDPAFLSREAGHA